MEIFIVIGNFSYESSEWPLGVFTDLEEAKKCKNSPHRFEYAVIYKGKLNSTDFEEIKD